MLRTTAAEAGRIGDALAEWWGRPVVEKRDPDGDGVGLEVYFEKPVEAELAARALPAEWAQSWHVHPYREEDWAESWKQHFHAMDIGKRLRIVPPWLASESSGRIEIVINPGLSFGTGQHFTTRFCLEQIDRLLAEQPEATVLDVGTGSGILSIAAARLGAGRVTGIDSDPVCVQQSRKNATRNGVTERIDFECRDIQGGWTGEKADLVCANLYGQLLIALAPVLLPTARRRLVLSGIGVKELDEVASAYTASGAGEELRAQDHEWAGLVLIPPGTGKAGQSAHR